MPRRNDLKTIMLVGSGPIVIGQACEFDYSGTQACKALRDDGYRIVLINSNPATIMTDPETADRTYIEPITPETVARIIERERPDALLPTMGGQTALNIAMSLAEGGVLEKFGVELIGASREAIHRAEDRDAFKRTMAEIGLDVPESAVARSREEAEAVRGRIGFPAIIRPSFTLGGTGGNIARTPAEYDEFISRGLAESPRREVLVESSLLGWKEYELEVMRDRKDNVVIVCTIENFDPMGVHTGDSITVAPAQTLTDREYQRLRDASLKIIRAIGVDTGGSNIQFAVNPSDGRVMVIEMNPRVSRSSALASKATGFPIAKIAAKLAVGYTLDEIPNDITKKTPASFEPTIDYVVVKVPRFNFEKFPQCDATLTTQMKSVGETMTIGRTFPEAFQKALASLEIGSNGLESRLGPELGTRGGRETIRARLSVPNWERVWYMGDAIRAGFSTEEIHALSAVDPWFIEQIRRIVDAETEIPRGLGGYDPRLARHLKRLGFTDKRLADLSDGAVSERDIRCLRESWKIAPVYKTIDTCGGEFEAHTPYLYSTYEEEDEARPSQRRKVVILGGGPNRIGQGIEFDYCCVHGVFGLRKDGFETIMINCNPETVSTDYDTADRLYFEPLTLEHVLPIIRAENPDGVIVQFGGQTPLKLALPLMREGVPILGTSPDSIDQAEDRERFKALLHAMDLAQPESGVARSPAEARRVAEVVGYPVMVRPSYVLGGRAMEIVYDEEMLDDYMTRAVLASPEHPVLIDRYLENAVEIDVDAVADGRDVVIGGILEHIEEAGVHSGDSACSLPPHSLPPAILAEVRVQTDRLARALGVVGLINIQFAVANGRVYVLEVNPRASRTVPFVSKAIGVPLAQIAARVMGGRTLQDLGFTREREIPYFAVKEAVFPFAKFPGVDTLLGPEMRSTGEVMGIDREFGLAFLKSQIGAAGPLPESGVVFISLKDQDKEASVEVARGLADLGYDLMATGGTAAYLRDRGLAVASINKVKEGSPHVVDAMEAGRISLVINTVHGAVSQRDSYSIRRTALNLKIPYFTTLSGARATVTGLASARHGEMSVKSLQEYHA
ncbi:MAG: carbamoyl phosphate synthase large subunit [Nitrospirae bacterium RBG_16_64_22]|nr:MAG: carbamoyl phosphate synthase large subunit [Nitrospirae bacterium RBG_16_64_22]